MPVQVKQSKKETVITVSGALDPEQLEQAIRYLRYLSLTRNYKKVTQAAAGKLAEEIDEAAFRKRQRRIAS